MEFKNVRYEERTHSEEHGIYTILWAANIF